MALVSASTELVFLRRGRIDKLGYRLFHIKLLETSFKELKLSCLEEQFPLQGIGLFLNRAIRKPGDQMKGTKPSDYRKKQLFFSVELTP